MRIEKLTKYNVKAPEVRNDFRKKGAKKRKKTDFLSSWKNGVSFLLGIKKIRPILGSLLFTWKESM